MMQGRAHRQAHLATTQQTAHTRSDAATCGVCRLDATEARATCGQQALPAFGHCQKCAGANQQTQAGLMHQGCTTSIQSRAHQASHSVSQHAARFPPTCKPRPAAALLPALVPAAATLVVHVPAVQVLVLLLLAVVPVVALCLVAALLAPAVALLRRIDVAARVICRPQGTRADTRGGT